MDELNLEIDLGEINRYDFFARLEKVCGISARTIRNEIDGQLSVDRKLVVLIEKLKTKYKIGLLSNAGKEEIDVIYRDKIDGLFDSITISYEVKAVKPNVDIFLVCLKRLGVQPQEALFIDDSTTNVNAARKVNMQALHYPEFGKVPEELSELAKL